MEKSKARPTPNIERTFLNDEMQSNQIKYNNLISIFRQTLIQAKNFLTYFDFIRFCKLLSQIDQRKQKEIASKHFFSIRWMRQQQFGNSISASEFSNIHNLANYSLFEVEKLFLTHKLDFCLPLIYIKQEEALAEFEALIGQLQNYSPSSKTDFVDY